MIHATSVAEEDAAMQDGANGDEKTKQDGIEIDASTTNPGMIHTTSVAEEGAAMQEATTSLEHEVKGKRMIQSQC